MWNEKNDEKSHKNGKSGVVVPLVFPIRSVHKLLSAKKASFNHIDAPDSPDWPPGGEGCAA